MYDPDCHPVKKSILHLNGKESLMAGASLQLNVGVSPLGHTLFCHIAAIINHLFVEATPGVTGHNVRNAVKPVI
jgi:hypothetical protein